MNFNLSELENLFNEINEIINYFEFTRYQNRRQRLFLSNGDKLNYLIPKEAIPHLLGINTTYLVSTGLFKSKNSFELMKEMCENPYKIHKSNTNNIINYKELFSEHILKKVSIFKENIAMKFENILLVCKYNRDRAYLTDQLAQKFDYIIVKRYENGKIGVLGLANNGNCYVPMSNQLYDSYDKAKENLEKYLKNQEITLISGIQLFNSETDYNKNVYLSLNEKISRIQNLSRFKKLYNCSINISGDCEYLLGKSLESKDNKSEESVAVDEAIKDISRGKIVNKEKLGINDDSNIGLIISAYNDFLCQNSVGKNNSTEITYTKAINELKKLKEELLKCEELNVALQEENEELRATNNDLNEEIESNEESFQKIFSILNSRKDS